MTDKGVNSITAYVCLIQLKLDNYRNKIASIWNFYCVTMEFYFHYDAFLMKKHLF